MRPPRPAPRREPTEQPQRPPPRPRRIPPPSPAEATVRLPKTQPAAEQPPSDEPENETVVIPAVVGDRPAAAPKRPGRIVFIDIVRAVAALWVFYGHVDILFLQEEVGYTWFTSSFNYFVGPPLHLAEEGIGAAAVPLFFLVSGFIITPIALKMGGGRFMTNRLMRLYPPLIAAVSIAVIFAAFGLSPLILRSLPDITVGTVLSNMTLINFFQRPLGAFVGVAWTLAVELLFCILLAAMLPLLRRWIWAALAVEIVIIVGLILLGDLLGGTFGVFASELPYLLAPIMGQAIWAGWNEKIPGWLAGSYLAVCWGLYVWTSHLDLADDYVLRPAPMAFGLLIMLVGVGMESRLRQRAIWTWLSDRSFSLYLMHAVVAFPVMRGLVNVVPLWLTLLLGVAATVLAVELCFRFVENPSHNLARKLSRRAKKT
ncbi:acyltransferase family protein [Actinoalloteichus hymeniacidonis]|uniref:Acyltransferase n=1 Tax=Actinoalloteichus hymeniacidonis TaxID=340345 RepID=A0AAC9HS50_9PSEU|nr:acyltransferase [Actinoalloteichus hymeniacidonis]AOS64166.1 putative acyltransferase [Actinoalloteichus hymeniacidonis]MBB5907767.1 peptidoglycan/LPS O-acetylase OafA/YrhL [Actinoalloteichus hymeniacidonis]